MGRDHRRILSCKCVLVADWPFSLHISSAPYGPRYWLDSDISLFFFNRPHSRWSRESTIPYKLGRAPLHHSFIHSFIHSPVDRLLNEPLSWLLLMSFFLLKRHKSVAKAKKCFKKWRERRRRNGRKRGCHRRDTYGQWSRVVTFPIPNAKVKHVIDVSASQSRLF